MRESMPKKSTENEKGDKISGWKHKAFSAGHEPKLSKYKTHFTLSFLLLVAIHASVFIADKFPLSSFILLAALVKGWLNAA